MTTRSDGPVEDKALHRIVVVGGGAAGLELVTRIGDHLARRRRASVTLVDSLEPIFGSHCCTKWRRAAWTPANTR